MNEPSKTEQALTDFAKRELGDIKVLMIEDDHFISELVLTKLSQQGCVPYSAPNGKEGLKLVEQYRPNLIILDLMLPEIPGEEVLRQLKSNPELKNIPVIVFSNKSEPSDIDANLKLGAAEYFVKSSTDLNTLAGAVKRLAGKGA